MAARQAPSQLLFPQADARSATTHARLATASSANNLLLIILSSRTMRLAVRPRTLFCGARILFPETRVKHCPVLHRLVENLALFEQPMSVLLHQLVLVMSEVE